MVSHNSARLITALFGVSGSGRILVPVNFRLVAEEVRYIVEHSGASLLLVDPELDEALSSVTCARRLVIGKDADEALLRFGVEPEPWAGDEDATATINYTSGHDRPAEGRAAHPSQHLAQRHDVRLAHGRDRPRRLPAHAAAVPLQRLGDAVRGHRDGRPAHRAAQGRRRRDPAPRRAPRRDADVRGAGGRQHGARRGGRVGRRDPRSRARCASSSPARRRRRARSSASRPSSGGSSTRSTGSPRRRRC